MEKWYCYPISAQKPQKTLENNKILIENGYSTFSEVREKEVDLWEF